MLSRLLHKKHAERGNSFLMYILLFPVIFTFFGLALDTGISYYTRVGIQSAADSAALAGSTQFNNGAYFTLNQPRADATAKSIYGDNRKEYPNLLCAYGKQCYSFTSEVYNQNRGSTTTRNNVYRITIQEKSRTLFLNFLGMSDQSYTIKAQARIGSNLE